MSRHGIGRRPSKPKIELIALPKERCVLVRRGKRIYQLNVSTDGSRLQVVGELQRRWQSALRSTWVRSLPL